MSKHTPGPWIVTERRHPYKDGSKAHIERNIYTEWDHPQLRGKYPIACVSVGIGMDGEKAVQFVHIEEADARLIAAAPDLLEALLDALSVLQSVSTSRDRRVVREGCVLYMQTEEWCKWAEDEVGAKARAAIAKATGGQA